jgi:DNA-binding NtrC family response regulator
MPTVFVVDDHQDTAEALSMFIQSSGYTTEYFTDFKSAEYRIIRDHPCLVFTDFHMLDETSAPEFIRTIKSRFLMLKIVVISGDNRKRAEAEKLGVEFLLKPVNMDEIEKICKRYCTG